MAGVILATRRWHGFLSFDAAAGVQKIHQGSVPRIGGVAVLVVALSAAILPGGNLVAAILLAGSVAFGVGLLEDLTKRVGARTRLAATMLSALLFIWITGFRIDHADIPGIDALVAIAPIGILLTTVAAAGMANAINLIDGVNGLAGGTMVILFAGFGSIAGIAGDAELALASWVFAGAVAGFLVWNWPGGRIFLGDGGAYFGGFALAAIAIMLPSRNPDISPFVSVMVLAYPVTETLFSVVRRVRCGRPAMEPDRLHLHSLSMRQWPRRLAMKIGQPALINPLTALAMWRFPAIAVAVAVSAVMAGPVVRIPAIGLALFVAYYLAAYRRAAWCGRMAPAERGTSLLRAALPDRVPSHRRYWSALGTTASDMNAVSAARVTPDQKSSQHLVGSNASLVGPSARMRTGRDWLMNSKDRIR